jgi:hypothetical protein
VGLRLCFKTLEWKLLAPHVVAADFPSIRFLLLTS